VKNRYLSSAAGVAVASVLGAAGSAQAQTLPSWQGFYVGAFAGGAWGRSDATTITNCSVAGIPPGYFCSTPLGAANGLAVNTSGTGSMSGSGFTGGVQIGHNWQRGNFLYGAEADFGSFNLRGSRQASAFYPTAAGTVATTELYTVGSSFKTDWLFTLRARAGWARDNWLIFGTAGLAVTRLEVTTSFSDTNLPAPGASGAGTASATKPGFAIGGGVEWAISNRWTVKGEYLFVNFGKVTANATVTHPGAGLAAYSQAISTTADLSAHLARAGVNYRF
jgi:outer membrane immunogenic protein